MRVYDLVLRIREQKPLVHHITNWVTISDCAMATRCVGALPVMAHAVEEAEDMTGISSALVLNIGTLTSDLLEAMHASAKKANEKKIPVILDAVGAGATPMRSKAVKDLLSAARIDVLKGNAGEIGSVAGVQAEVRGVESISVAGEPKELAAGLAAKLKNTVVISGKDDVVSDGKRTLVVRNGHELMGRVVGTGCMAASMIGAFCAVEREYCKASAAGMAVFGVAGELAAEKARGPNAFKQALMDELCCIDEKIDGRVKIVET